jgi:hypothetical protein
MLQADPDLRPSEIERIMQRTGTDVKHLENDDIFSLVNARRAVEEVLPETPMPSETPEPSATPTREATNEPSDTPTPEPGTPATSPTAAERTPTSTRTAAPTRTRTVNDDYDLFLPALKNLAR